MDLIGSLSSQLGLPETQAKGLAGGLLGLVQKGLAEQAGPEAAQELEAQVPEMASWQAEGDTPEGEPGIGDLLGSLGGGLGGMLGGLGGGGGETTALVGAAAGLIQKFGLSADQAGAIAPMIAGFLEQKVGPELMGKVRPLLGLLGGGGGGGIGGMLGGLLG